MLILVRVYGLITSPSWGHERDLNTSWFFIYREEFGDRLSGLHHVKTYYFANRGQCSSGDVVFGIALWHFKFLVDRIIFSRRVLTRASHCELLHHPSHQLQAFSWDHLIRLHPSAGGNRFAKKAVCVDRL